MKLKIVKGWYLPDYDTHFESMLKEVNGEFTYQQSHRDYVLEFVDKFDIAIDVGANVGFWSKDFCRKFKKVWAFEPVYDISDCYRRNMAAYDNWHLEQVGLSDKQGENVPLYKGIENSGGGSLVESFESASNKVEHIDIKMLDNYINDFDTVDLIKVDIQGHEYKFLMGALEFLNKFSPTLSLELPIRTDEEILIKKHCVKLLEDIGYKEVGRHKKDTVFKK